MKLTFEEIRAASCGAVSLEQTKRGIGFHRFTPEQEAVYWPEADSTPNATLLSTAGIKLRFTTDSTLLTLRGAVTRVMPDRSLYAIDIKQDGKLIDSIQNYDEKTLTSFYATGSYPLCPFENSFSLGVGTKTLEIHLPYSVIFYLQDLILSDGASFAPKKRSKTLLAFGDSITHGFDALHPSAKYATLLADMLDAEEWNRGIGGACFTPTLSQPKESFIPDIITVAYGTNDFSCQIPRQQFSDNCRQFILNLAHNYPDSPIFLIAPIWRADKMQNDVLGHLGDMHQLFTELTADIPHVFVIPGYELVPHDPLCFGDGFLHPNDNGFAHMAKALAEKIKSSLKQEQA